MGVVGEPVEVEDQIDWPELQPVKIRRPAPPPVDDVGDGTVCLVARFRLDELVPEFLSKFSGVVFGLLGSLGQEYPVVPFQSVRRTIVLHHLGRVIFRVCCDRYKLNPDIHGGLGNHLLDFCDALCVQGAYVGTTGIDEVQNDDFVPHVIERDRATVCVLKREGWCRLVDDLEIFLLATHDFVELVAGMVGESRDSSKLNDKYA